ncbi:HAAS signaling domain-containing protein [Pseudonocardia parietis]|uniref:Uncharacterized membrane protein YuzA (DUF378 family) n=1 Tax=Pseudonocardia parietis TaxID=570936 RepID=A0ABS4W1Q4_9PSEU|nr:hypothetical protein [Pseudonocardia parietis]MBP2370127.1 uncharacterized membrane protein YuzA (DUF378 family) [Pseudonocardia parietis]
MAERTGTDASAGTEETIRIEDAVTTEYLDGLRTALIDLPPAELAEIVEDARGHLADLAGELGPSYDRAAVHERLGTPATYAAELRAAAGFPAPPASTVPDDRSPRFPALFAVLALVCATALAGLGGLVELPLGLLSLLLGLPVAAVGVLPVFRDGPRQPAVAALGPVRALDRIRPRPGGVDDEQPRRELPAFLASLQPGWWLLRGVVAAAAVAALFGGDGSTALLVTVLVALAAVPVSVLLGHRTRADRRLLWVVVPLNAFAAGLVVAAAGAFAADDSGGYDSAGYADAAPSGLARDGEPVTDVRPFDAQGRPLSGVYLFDQDGLPLAVGDHRCVPASRTDYGAPEEPGPYPLGTRTSDPETGECVTTPPAPMVVTIPGATPTPAGPGSSATSVAPAPAAPGASGAPTPTAPPASPAPETAPVPRPGG